MSEKYGEDQPWHLTQEPDESPSYEELEDSIKALNKKLSEANKRGDAWRFRADIAEVKLAKALAGLNKAAALIEDRHVVHMTSKGRNPKDYISDWSLIAKEVRALLAEIEGKEP
jgi:hypothetical protein